MRYINEHFYTPSFKGQGNPQKGKSKKDLHYYFFVVSIRASDLLTSNLKAANRVANPDAALATAPNYTAILLFPLGVGRKYKQSGQPFFLSMVTHAKVSPTILIGFARHDGWGVVVSSAYLAFSQVFKNWRQSLFLLLLNKNGKGWPGGLKPPPGLPSPAFFCVLKLQSCFLHTLYNKVIKQQPPGGEGTVSTGPFPANFFIIFRFFKHLYISPGSVFFDMNPGLLFTGRLVHKTGKKTRTGRIGIAEAIQGHEQIRVIKDIPFPGYCYAEAFCIQGNSSARFGSLLFKLILKVALYCFSFLCFCSPFGYFREMGPGWVFLPAPTP